MLFWIGIPLLFLEMAIGQRVQHASIDLWKTLGPWFGGLGYSTFLVRSPKLPKPAPTAAPHPSLPASALPPRHISPALQVCFIINTYTNLFNSWILFYMSHIFYFTVPWQHCPLQRNSSSFGEEGEVEKRRYLG